MVKRHPAAPFPKKAHAQKSSMPPIRNCNPTRWAREHRGRRLIVPVERVGSDNDDYRYHVTVNHHRNERSLRMHSHAVSVMGVDASAVLDTLH